MAETHKEITKVWIAPGCIVCDACETDCPEVFDVQEETCVIRPQANNADFTKPLTPSIITAAEGCPVEVIKFETIDVEGPEPWAGKEAEGAGAGSSGAASGKASGGTKKAAWTPPEGPPDPKWAGLLANAYTSRDPNARRSSEPLTAKAPPEAIKRALPKGAPPDAIEAAMVGSGFAKPRPGVVQKIREKTAGMSRREALAAGISAVLLVAWGSLAVAFANGLGMLQNYLVPKVINEPPSVFRAGKISDYAEVGVYEQYKGSNGVWIVHEHDGTLVALSDICTHLGCIPNWLPADQKFKCPCHGSGYYMTGVNFEGPAPRPLERFKIYLDGEFVFVDKSVKYRQELKQWGLPGSEIAV
ncbi:MAG: Rieske 2Fe-2S domain-containing protein [Phycisphaera sp.]|nr:Rieske 2Fe-2S domain-containing protein [Phycisphaera sp.]